MYIQYLETWIYFYKKIRVDLSNIMSGIKANPGMDRSCGMSSCLIF